MATSELIDLPKAPVPYERIVYRAVAEGDWFIRADGDEKWCRCNPNAGAIGYMRLCLDLPSPKVQFPASVPGFKKGTWFVRRGDGGWWFTDGHTRPEPEGSGSWRSSGDDLYYAISVKQTAHAVLKTLSSVPWDQSCFQTTEDG